MEIHQRAGAVPVLGTGARTEQFRLCGWNDLEWRRGWDSNPRALSDKTLSRRPRYDHFGTSPLLTPLGGAPFTFPTSLRARGPSGFPSALACPLAPLVSGAVGPLLHSPPRCALAALRASLQPSRTLPTKVARRSQRRRRARPCFCGASAGKPALACPLAPLVSGAHGDPFTFPTSLRARGPSGFPPTFAHVADEGCPP